MRRVLYIVASLFAAGCGNDGEAVRDFDYPRDDELRVSHLQSKGTHNSYHIAPDPFVTAEWNYSHAPLDEQLAAQGVRQVELDVNFDYSLERWEVYHAYRADEETTCRLLVDCLQRLKDWSDTRPGHAPIGIMIEIKEGYIDEYEATFVATLESELASVWPRDRLLTPDDVRGDAATLREAVTTVGWPTLAAARGKAIVWLDNEDEHRSYYTFDDSHVDGRLMFPDAPFDAPYAAIRGLNNPVTQAADIAEAVAAGMLVRTRLDVIGDDGPELDPDKVAAALASGAHFLSTDVTSYAVPDGEPVACNPVTAPASCTATDAEDPAFID